MQPYTCSLGCMRYVYRLHALMRIGLHVLRCITSNTGRLLRVLILLLLELLCIFYLLLLLLLWYEQWILWTLLLRTLSTHTTKLLRFLLWIYIQLLWITMTTFTQNILVLLWILWKLLQRISRIKNITLFGVLLPALLLALDDKDQQSSAEGILLTKYSILEYTQVC